MGISGLPSLLALAGLLGFTFLEAIAKANLRRAEAGEKAITMNSLQFDVRADFDRYPRPIDDDLAACAAAGVDAVYAPTAGAMYPH
eukprot:gene41733-55353_t